MNKKKHPVSKRALARLAAVQALYDIDISETDVEMVIKDFSEGLIGREVLDEDIEMETEEFIRIGDYDKDLMEHIVRGVVLNAEGINETINNMLTEEWKNDRLEKLVMSILRCGFFEIFYLKDIPAKVTISEYINLAHAFYTDSVPNMVNAMLDMAARQERPEEFK